MIELTIDTKGLEGVIDELGAMPQQVQAAMRSTLTKMAGWVRTRSTRGLSKELALQQKIVRRRLKVAGCRPARTARACAPTAVARCNLASSAGAREGSCTSSSVRAKHGCPSRARRSRSQTLAATTSGMI